MQNKKTIRCTGAIHKSHNGNILIAFNKDSIFVKCQDRDCKRWSKITVNIPGVEIDLSKAGIIQEVMAIDYHLHLETTTTVVSSGK